MATSALDPSYAKSAAGRPAGPRNERRRPARLVALLLVVVGLFTGVAAGQARRGADEADAVRRSLVDDVRQQTRTTDRLAARASALRSEVTRLRDRALGEGASGRSAAAQLTALELVTGTVPVHGPGIVVTLDDAAAASRGTAQRGGQAGDGRVYDRDLQDAVNAVWAAGAEAVSVNGQRLTALTAIRSAGEAILVDLRPLSPPYVVRAVGNPDDLEPAFADSAAARRLTTYTSLYGLGFAVRRAASLALPAAGSPVLRVAQPGAGR